METTNQIKSEFLDVDVDEQEKQPNKRPKVDISQNPTGFQEKIEKASPTKKSKSKQKVKTDQQSPDPENKKYKHREEHNLSGYNKKAILDYLKKHGSSRRDFENALGAFKVREDIALEFFNKQVEQAQANVYQECDSLSFDNISAWLSVFKSWQLPEECFFELPAVMNAIAKNESQPAPSELDGIDLSSAYKFLGNALLGLPQPGLNAETAAFLADEFENLINDANTDAGDIATRDLKHQLLMSAPPPPYTNQKQKISLDPLRLDDTI